MASAPVPSSASQDAASASSFTPFPTAVQWSHHIIGPRLRPGDIVLDATAGNGHDTLFLAERVLPGGQVHAFDLQAAAVEATRRTLDAASPAFLGSGAVNLIHTGHERLAEVLPPRHRGRLRAVMFNLGYLPGGDKSLVTRLDTTLAAVTQALDWLAPGGVMTLVLYPGHEGGAQEAAALVDLIAALPPATFEAQRITCLNFRPTTPFLLALHRRTYS